MEVIKTWAGTIASLTVGGVGFIEKCNELFNLAFVILGCVGLILSIRLTHSSSSLAYCLPSPQKFPSRFHFRK